MRSHHGLDLPILRLKEPRATEARGTLARGRVRPGPALAPQPGVAEVKASGGTLGRLQAQLCKTSETLCGWVLHQVSRAVDTSSMRGRSHQQCPGGGPAGTPLPRPSLQPGVQWAGGTEARAGGTRALPVTPSPAEGMNVSGVPTTATCTSLVKRFLSDLPSTCVDQRSESPTAWREGSVTNVRAGKRSWPEARSGVVQEVTLLHLFRGPTACPAENSVWLTGGHVTYAEPIGNCPGTFLTAPGRAEFCTWGQMAAVSPEWPGPKGPAAWSQSPRGRINPLSRKEETQDRARESSEVDRGHATHEPTPAPARPATAHEDVPDPHAILAPAARCLSFM